MLNGIRNIFSGIPSEQSEELFQTLFTCDTIRVERIVSDGHATPEGVWYDQAADEWVLLLAGSAGIFCEGDSGEQLLVAGDFLMIPAGRRHRVTWTDPEQKTVWLAIHFG